MGGLGRHSALLRGGQAAESDGVQQMSVGVDFVCRQRIFEWSRVHQVFVGLAKRIEEKGFGVFETGRANERQEVGQINGSVDCGGGREHIRGLTTRTFGFVTIL